MAIAIAEPRAKRRPSLLSLVEALATPHGIDRYLELVHPMLTVRELRAEIIEVDRSIPETLTLTLRPTRQWEGFRAGQFVQLSLDIDGVRRTRCYSPIDSHHDTSGRIRLSIKAHPYGLVSQHLHANAAPGMVVGLSQAAGGFGLPEPRPERIVLISGGSGITPVLSMLRTLCDEDYAGEVAFLHYAAAESVVPHLADLRDLAAGHPNVRIVLVYPESGGGDLDGFFGREHLDVAAPWHADAQTYVCGPPALMRSVKTLYTDAGLGDRLAFEDFAPGPVVPNTDEVSGDIEFTVSAATVPNNGATLLEQAEAAGLTPAYGCRMGICFTCTTVKTAGCTRNVLTGEVNADPDTEVQLCISAPVGDVALNL